MASLMPMCAGLVGPKSENVEKVVVFKPFLRGPRRARVIQDSEQASEKDPISHCIFGSKCFVWIWGIVLPASAGSTFLYKSGKYGRKVKNAS